jgi:hypothetical protein
MVYITLSLYFAAHFLPTPTKTVRLKMTSPSSRQDKRSDDKPVASVAIKRVWAMPNKWTFTIKPIRELLQDEIHGGLWCDPFAGENSPAQVTNDLDETAPTTHHMDALSFLRLQEKGKFDGVLFDPPYSITQARQLYQGRGMELLDVKPTSMKYWSECKNELNRILKPNGKAICFGWTSMGLGINRGFEMYRILLVPHGGSKNDTIVTVEHKLVQANKGGNKADE